ncbi:MAG: ATP-binding cassette domain-containing protein [Acidimicrobiia bacterium]
MLELDQLSKRFGDIVALDEATLRAQPGRILGFLGPNGAGKTTAMRSIFGLVALDHGTVTWNDKPIDAAARRRFGYMPEQRGLYPKMKVSAQISWFAQLRGMERGAADRATTEVLERLGLGGRTDERLENLSHGNQQRAQVAASLIHSPELLVLDEPFSGLDPTGVDSMTEVIRARAAEGAAVLFSSHQLDLVEDVCDDVAIINRGQVVLTGTLAGVRSQAPRRRMEVRFADPSATWAPPAGELIREADGTRVYMVPETSDPNALLAAAASAGKVESFSFGPPYLSEIFREAIR